MVNQDNGVGPVQLRSFGLVIGGILAVIALWPTVFHGDGARIWALIGSALLAFPALIRPTSLRPIYKAWMRIGSVLAWANTRIILSIGFYGVFTPMAIIMRVFRKDPLRRGFDPDMMTYRVARSPRPGSHMRQQF